MDDVVLLNLFGTDLLGAELYDRFNLKHISNSEAKEMFRFEKVHIPRLTNSLGIPEHVTDEHITVTSKVKFR